MKQYVRVDEDQSVLKIHVIHSGGHGYYLHGAEVGTELELPGQWTGPAASSLGLNGQVQPEGFGEVMGGRHPANGQVLRLNRGAVGVSGFDLTFCAPKSVSLLHALAPREIAEAAEAGHRAAVEDASAYLSRHGIGVCRGGGESRQLLPSTGMVAGEFRHRVSRAMDPHLHTHLVAANVAHGPDGRWSAVDGRRLFAHLRAGGRLYQSRLRLELSQRLGAGWDVRPSGLGDVVGVDPSLRRLFSQRQAAIEEFVAVRGSSGQTASTGAFYATRPEKDLNAGLDELVGTWKQRASDFGFDLSELSGVVGRGRIGHGSPGIDADRLAEGLVPRSGGTLARRDLVAAVAASAVGGATVGGVERVVDRITEAVNPDRTRLTAREPRWPADEVVRLARGEERIDSLVNAPLSTEPVERGRMERSPWRGRGRGRGMELGR